MQVIQDRLITIIIITFTIWNHNSNQKFQYLLYGKELRQLMGPLTPCLERLHQLEKKEWWNLLSKILKITFKLTLECLGDSLDNNLLRINGGSMVIKTKLPRLFPIKLFYQTNKFFKPLQMSNVLVSLEKVKFSLTRILVNIIIREIMGTLMTIKLKTQPVNSTTIIPSRIIKTTETKTKTN